MKGARFPYLLVGGLLLLLTFAAIRTAIAAQPLTFTEHFEYTFVVDCGAFIAEDEIVEDDRITIFFDNEGNAVGAQVHVMLRGIVKNSVTGTSAPDHADFTVFVDFAEGTTALVAKWLGIAVPGEGIAVLDAGKIVFDAGDDVIFVGGPHQFLFEEGPTALCAAVD